MFAMPPSAQSQERGERKQLICYRSRAGSAAAARRVFARGAQRRGAAAARAPAAVYASAGHEAGAVRRGAVRAFADAFGKVRARSVWR